MESVGARRPIPVLSKKGEWGRLETTPVPSVSNVAPLHIPLILRGNLLGAVDHKHVHRTFARFEPQSQLLLQRRVE